MVPNHKMRDMKKEAKVEYGIAIVKPWSTEMYNHNELVADIVRNLILGMWIDALDIAEARVGAVALLSELDWEHMASAKMIDIQTAITCYRFGFGYTIEAVCDRVEDELENAPLYRLKEIAEELELELEKGFIGFN